MVASEESSSEIPEADVRRVRDIYSDFEAYLTTTDEQYRKLFKHGLIVLDTNTLHNLYRYAEQTRLDFFAALTVIQERLWVPYQVIVEFWRNRDAVMRDRNSSSVAVAEAVMAAHGAICDELDKWAKRVSLAPEVTEELRVELKRGHDVFIASIQSLRDEKVEASRDTERDPVLSQLNVILAGRVGEPFSGAEMTRAIEEGKRRIENKIPPGYKDANKSNVQAFGDYFVWRQMIAEAAKRKVDVLFITGDVKEDWWRIDGGQTKGPRVELYQEMLDAAGGRLRMLRPESFLYHAQRLLDVRVNPESIQDVERVEELSARETSAARSVRELPSFASLLLESYLDFLFSRGWVISAINVSGQKMPLFHLWREDEWVILQEVSERRNLRGVPGAVGSLHRERVIPEQRDKIRVLHKVLVLRQEPRASVFADVANRGIICVWRSPEGVWRGNLAAERRGFSEVAFAIETLANEEASEEVEIGQIEFE